MASVVSLPWFVIAGMEKVAEGEAGEPSHSQTLKCVRFMQWGRLKLLSPKSGRVLLLVQGPGWGQGDQEVSRQI